MATSQENADIAVLKSEIITIKETMGRIEGKLDTASSSYVTHGEFNEFKKRWFLSHTLAGVAGAVLTGVIIYILTHFGS